MLQGFTPALTQTVKDFDQSVAAHCRLEARAVAGSASCVSRSAHVDGVIGVEDETAHVVSKVASGTPTIGPVLSHRGRRCGRPRLLQHPMQPALLPHRWSPGN